MHPQLPVLAFLMAAAAKGYTLGQTLGTACLHIIHDLAVVPLQDMTSKGAATILETLSVFENTPSWSQAYTVPMPRTDCGQSVYEYYC